MGRIGGQELLVILLILLFLFGGSKLPDLARSLGRAQKEFKTGLDEGEKGDVDSGEETSA